MNTQKFKMSNCGLLSEADRSMYKGKDTISKSLIDPARTHLNYNLCPHPQYKTWEVKDIHERIRGKKMRKDGVAWGSTIITLPKDYSGDTRAFFETAYKGLKKMYGLRDEDVVSAYVHMDETTPHLHFYFIPVVHEQNRDRVSWDTVMPRAMYQTQHRVLQKYMTEQLHTTVTLLNGETKGIDVQGLTAAQKRASMELEKAQEEVTQAKEELVTLELATQDKREGLQKAQKEVQEAKVEKSTLKSEIGEIRQNKEGLIQSLWSEVKRLYKSLKTQEKRQEVLEGRAGKQLRLFGRANALKEQAKKELDTFMGQETVDSIYIDDMPGLTRTSKAIDTYKEELDRVETMLQDDLLPDDDWER